MVHFTFKHLKQLLPVLLLCLLATTGFSQIAEFEGTARSTSPVPEFQLYDNASIENRIKGRFRESGSTIFLESVRGPLSFGAGTNGSAPTRMVIDGNRGNIGIGTYPATSGFIPKLHIRENNQAIRLEGSSPYIAWYTGNTREGLLWMSQVNELVLSNETNNKIFFKTNATNRMIIEGNGSWISGKNVSTDGRPGCVFLGDSNPENDGSTTMGRNDQFAARFKGGYYFMTSGNTPRTGIRALAGANAWSSISDINRKENFENLDDKKNLDKLASVDYTSWNYKGQDPASFRHYGIMAQEFYDLFGHDSYGSIGNDTLVNPIDMIGITMSALKGASIKIEEQKDELSSLKKELSAIRSELIGIKELIINK